MLETPESSSKISELVEYRFPIDIERYSNNQTVCVGREAEEAWSEEVCETMVSTADREIVCKCNMARARWVSMWTNRGRKPGPIIAWLRT